MRECAEDEVGLLELRVLGCDERDVVPAYPRSLPPLSVGSCEAELETGMIGDEHAELAPRVAAGAKDADREFMHK